VSREMLRCVLSALGARGDEAPSGGDALDAIAAASERRPYDVVITESGIQDMELLSQRGKVPVILMTARDRRHGDAAALGNFAAYLNKPVKRAQLEAAVALAVHGTDAGTGDYSPQQVAVNETPGDDGNAPAEANGKRGLLLVVEDNPNNQIMALRQLEKLGHSVHIVSNGVQAVKAVAYGSNAYDLIFMDCQMPEMDGFEATRQIRSAEVVSGNHVPIVAMTANAMTGDRENCIAAGMDDYIAKPVTRHTLREALHRWLPVEV
jgi:two-component system sensor histidine kinase/response regulator